MGGGEAIFDDGDFYGGIWPDGETFKRGLGTLPRDGFRRNAAVVLVFNDPERGI